MKLVDKYLLREYFVPFAYCLLAFSLMYIVFDLFHRLPDFLQARVGLLPSALFYARYLVTINGNNSFLVLMLPTCLLLGALYSLARLTRHNELTAMRASGMSLPRLMYPFVAMAVACSVVAVFVQEIVAPPSSRWTASFLKEKLGKGARLPPVISDFPYYNSSLRRSWLIGRFDPSAPSSLTGVKIVVERPDGTRAEEILAERAEWLDGRWWFHNLRTCKYGSRGEPLGGFSEPSPHPTEMMDLSEMPQDFANEVCTWEILSSREMARYLRTHPRLSDENRAIKTVDLYSRLAMPWTCLVVVLLGIPAGAKTGRQGMLMGVVLAIAFFFCFYAVVHFSLFFGKRHLMWPWLAAWLPNISFSITGFVMLFRMR